MKKTLHFQIISGIMIYAKGYALEKTDANNHLVFNYKNGDFIGNEVARIKPSFPQSVRYININLQSRRSVVLYTGVSNSDGICIKNEITVTSDKNTIDFEMPISLDEYFNVCLMHDIKVQYEEIQKICEVALLLTTERNGIII